ncbi:hypothetical protein CesoFtcFv8_027387 [Champsocephalus esox]|uniref:Uncharacterized protein n=1 Tax=Champsocephalus esox TaxID=159716 RepID=A0AAN8AYV9_9TELE|nr:hypothetical protein CesoFtcFv8_027387 [Champsocephalus esox]
MTPSQRASCGRTSGCAHSTVPTASEQKVLIAVENTNSDFCIAHASLWSVLLCWPRLAFILDVCPRSSLQLLTGPGGSPAALRLHSNVPQMAEHVEQREPHLPLSC